jgi:starch phosphorylase
MVEEYVERQYTPAATAVELADAEGFRAARELAAYRQRLSGSWPHIRVTSCDLSLNGSDTPVLGERVAVRASVDLAGLSTSDVQVQAVIGRVADSDELFDVVTVPMTPDGNGQYAAEVALPHAGALGVTARVLPNHELLASPVELGRVVHAN